MTRIMIPAVGEPVVGVQAGITYVAAPTGDAVVDTANVLAATATPGLIQFQAGAYAINASLTYYAASRWAGAAEGATTISLTMDLYVSGVGPAHFLTPNGGGDFGPGDEWTISNISLIGPGSYTLGYAPCKTTAIRLNSNSIVGDNCYISGFFANVEFWGNHQQVRNSKLPNSAYALEFPDAMPTVGNQIVQGCDLTGSTIATVHCGGSGNADFVIWDATHMGFSPVCLFKTDNQSGWDGSGNPVYAGTPGTRPAFTTNQMNGLYCEAVGSTAILDISTGSGGGGVTLGPEGKWSSCGHSWAPSYASDIAPLNNAEWQGKWAVIARGISGPYETTPMTPGTVGTWKVASGGFVLRQDVIESNLFGSGSDWCGSNQGNVQVVTVTGGIGLLYGAVGTIAVGDLVEITGDWQVQRAQGILPVFGVAMTPGAAGGNCLVQICGTTSMNFDGVGQLTGGATVVQCASTPYKADLEANSPAMPAVGVSTQNGANPTVSCGGILLLPGLPAPQVILDSGPNLALAADSSFETASVAGWTAESNCAIAASTAAALDGTHSMLMTSTAAGQMFAIMFPNRIAQGIVPGQWYTALASFRAAATPQSCQISVNFYAAGGAGVGSQVFGSNVTDGTTGWVQSVCWFVPPATTATVQVQVLIHNTAAGGEAHYVDCVGVMPGRTNYWKSGEATVTVVGPVGYSPSGGDDTSMIYTAISDAFTDGGAVLLNDGVYHIDGPLLTVDQFGNSGYRTQLPIPYSPYSNPKAVITLRGTSSGDQGSGFGSGAPSTQGVVFLSNSTGGAWDGATTPSMIGGPNQAKGFTNVGLTVENIHFRTPSNPNLAAIHAGWITQLQQDKVTYDTTDAFPIAAQPTHPSGAAVIMPQNYCDPRNNASHVYIFGYYVGMVLGEHGCGGDIAIEHCYIALSPQESYHSNSFDYICTEINPYVIAGWSPSSGVQAVPDPGGLGVTLDIGMLEIEDNRTVDNWAKLVYHVWGAANITGRIRYHIVVSEVGINDEPWITDTPATSLVGIPDPQVLGGDSPTWAASSFNGKSVQYGTGTITASGAGTYPFSLAHAWPNSHDFIMAVPSGGSDDNALSYYACYTDGLGGGIIVLDSSVSQTVYISYISYGS